MKRTDTHRPSAINPADYEYVAEEFLAVQSLSDALCLKAQRDIIAEHQARTGGRYSSHEHGGNCMVCGSVNAIYTSLFYHAKSNSYVRMGHDCADKTEMGNAFARNSFRRAIEDAREAQAGKAKAKALLSDYGLSRCWELYTSTDRNEFAWEEVTITDIVSKFVRYGSISEKQQSFLRNLLTKIDTRAERQQAREQEKAAAAPCPTGRVTVTGVILKLEVRDTQFGSVVKMTVKAKEGYIVWTTQPASSQAKRGDEITFSATLTPSDKDNKFGFGKRPKLVSEKVETAKAVLA